jgi:T5SS/PEP-CTERM-associated repeat protein
MKTKSTSQTPRKFTKKNALLLTVTALALCACWSAVALADDCSNATRWRGTTGSWFVDGNWDNHVPDAATAAQVNNGGTAQISADAPMAEACSLTLGLNSGDSGTVQVSPPHGDLSIGETIFVGEGGKGNLTQTFGTITSASGSIASASGSNGSVTVDGTSSSWRVSGEVDVGGTTTVAGGTGLLTVTNSAILTAASVHVWKSGTVTGNGTVTTTSGTTVDGTVAPNGAGGTLNFGGALQLNSGATTQCKVTPQDPSTTPQVSVSAQVSLGGRLSVTMTGDFSSAPTRFALLYAGSVNSSHRTFDSKSITYPTNQCWTPQIDYVTDNNGQYHVYLDRIVCTN